MNLDFHKINGTNKHLNYDAFRQSVISSLTPTCKEAEVIILNRFPALFSSHTHIDFLVFINISNKNNNYYRVDIPNEHNPEQKDRVNIRNLFVAVSVIEGYEDIPIVPTDNLIQIDDHYVEFDKESNEIKWGLTNYLANRCGLIRNQITIHPLIWIKNNSTQHIKENIFIGNSLDYGFMEEVIKKNYYFKYSGYRDWYKNDILFEGQFKNILEQASKDSKEGYLTKKKIDRLQSRFDEPSEKAFNNIGKKLVEVKGKAGTGKSSNLLEWMLKNSKNNKKGVFLTYNHLLVNDIAKQIQSFENRLLDNVSKASTTTNTIHSFFYNIAKKLGVLLLMTEDRILELTRKLDERWIKIEQYLNQVRQEEGDISLAKLMMYVQNHREMDEGLKREAISIIKELQKTYRFLPNKNNVEIIYTSYRLDKLKKLENTFNSKIFITDYHKVLERILQATMNLEGFINDLNITDKFDLLEASLNLNSDLLLDDLSGKMDLEKLKTRFLRSIKGFASKRIVYVDEAQDCHAYERDILFNLFGSSNVVIANGDKQQLIRYNELCIWHISRAKTIDFYRYSKRRTSYRMKPAIVALANHVAEWYNIDLQLEPLDTEDHGSIILDFTNNATNHMESIKGLLKIGERQGCTPYDSLILLSPPSQSNYGIKGPINDSGDFVNETSEPYNSSVIINEFDNIITDNNRNRTGWELIEMAQSQIGEAYFWNGTGNVDKKKTGPPGSLSVRSIYYESCRGLEAWSIMNFGLDVFFESKKKQDKADEYLLKDLFDMLTVEERREMYAATWVLMAITRSIENCYIQISNPESSIYQCIDDFRKKNHNFVRIITK